MEHLIAVATKALGQLKAHGAPSSLVGVRQVECKEYNIESNKVNLIRTTFDQSLGMKAFIDQRMGFCSDNQWTDRDQESLALKTVNATKASLPDEANVMPEGQGRRNFSGARSLQDEVAVKGSPEEEAECDDEWVGQLLKEFLSESKERFPKTIIESSAVKFRREKRVHLSSAGSLLTMAQNFYEGFVMFTTKDGRKSSSFNYVSFAKVKDQVPLMQTAGLYELLRQSSEQTHLRKIPAKFTGDILVTPPCMEDILRYILGYIGTNQLLKKQSFLQNKLGQRVASPLLTLTANPVSNAFVTKEYWNGDGYLAANETLLDKGTLKSYLLSDYGARKLKEKRSLSSGTDLLLESGTSELKKLVRSISKGLLLGRISAGRPAENGDFSGVAKNSYYIENGEIQYPVTEVMVSGNFSRMLMDVEAVSSESLNFGFAQFPWVQFKNIVVS